MAGMLHNDSYHVFSWAIKAIKVVKSMLVCLLHVLESHSLFVHLYHVMDITRVPTHNTLQIINHSSKL